MATKLKRSSPVVALILYVLCVCLILLPFLELVQRMPGFSSFSLDYKQTVEYRQTIVPDFISAAWTLTASLPRPQGSDSPVPAQPSVEEVQNAKALLEANGSLLTYYVSTTQPPLEVVPSAEPRDADLVTPSLSPDSVITAAAKTSGEGSAGELSAAGDPSVTENHGSVVDYAASSYNTAASSFSSYAAAGEELLAVSWETYRPFGVRASQQGVDHIILVQDGRMREMRNDRTGQYVMETALRTSPYSAYLTPEMLADMERCTGYAFGFTVTNEAAFVPSHSKLYHTYYAWYRRTYPVVILIVSMVIGLVGLLLLLFRKKDLREAKAIIARCLGRLWVEVKLLALLMLPALWDLFYLENDVNVVVSSLFWALWLVVLDLRHNGKGLWKNSMFVFLRCWIQRMYRAMESRYPFSRRLKRRFVVFAGGAAALGVLGIMLGSIGEPEGVVAGLALGVVGSVLLVVLARSSFRVFEDMGKVSDYAAAIRHGTAGEAPILHQNSDFTDAVQNLRQVHSGMARMVEERIASEKMKVELITNVSHDLKTPLTSIVNYVDLLDKETLTPEHANGYVDVLVQKAQRLANLVQDLFEISKANSGDTELLLEQLSVNALVEQTVAEVEGISEQNDLQLRLSLDKQNPIVRADGRKLHRVLENLLGNCVKYALSGTRIYVEVQSGNGHAYISFKNIANYEMQFTAQEVVERFSRGDSARSTEGSGLGLAIAKSFLELNGGRLDIQLDGDLFKAIAVLPLYVPYQERKDQEGYTVATVEESISAQQDPGEEVSSLQKTVVESEGDAPSDSDPLSTTVSSVSAG